MALIICPECGKKFSDLAVACPECGFPTSEIPNRSNNRISARPNTIHNATSKQDDVIKYLKACYELEKNVRLQEEVVKHYRSLERDLSNYQKRFHPLLRTHKVIPDERYVYGNYPKYGKPNYQAGYYTPYDPICEKVIGRDVCYHELPHSPAEVRLYIRTTQNMKFGFFSSASDKVYAKLNAYNSAVSGENQKINVQNEQIKQACLKKVELVRIQLSKELQILSETKRILQAFYDKDIIYGKYRSLIPISVILEYFLSGRCRTLPDAYNKYEDELRQNIIIDKLDVVIKKLDSIEQTQYMLYDALNSVNKNLSSVSSGVNNALQSMKRIEDNSAVSAYNSKIIADNTSYQSYLATIAAHKYLY